VKILVLGNDLTLRASLVEWLTRQWVDTEVLGGDLADPDGGASATVGVDVVLLDTDTGSDSGFEVLRAIRGISDIPLITFTPPADELAQVRSLMLGADDCVAKPIRQPLLVARIKSVLRRARYPLPSESVVDFSAGDLQIRFQDHAVLLRGQPVKLTPVEYALLVQLVHNAGHVLPSRLLLDRVWGCDKVREASYVRLFIRRLRAKLETPGGPRYIRTEHRRGYRFVATTADRRRGREHQAEAPSA
jgi:two-component system KDP operon response regulator KdpE